MNEETHDRLCNLATAYMNAKEYIIDSGYAAEIDWQESVALDDLTREQFLEEAAWVVLSSGMSERVIRKKFDEISSALHNWDIDMIVLSQSHCRARALKAFNHTGKVDAILNIARVLYGIDFATVLSEIRQKEVEYIMKLPFMGPATSYHFAKNIGLDVVKPDRHLIRIARVAGYESPAGMCSDIAEFIGERMSVVDLVIWRFATLKVNYLDNFC